jgi:hypothetical protein
MQIEDTIALDLLRYDIQMAGYGLARGDSVANIGFNYAEATEGAGYTPIPTFFNDSPGEPRAFVLSNDGNTAAGNSDVLVIKSVINVLDEETIKSTVRYYDSVSDSYICRLWSETAMNPGVGNKVISINATSRKIFTDPSGSPWFFNVDVLCPTEGGSIRPNMTLSDSATFFTYLTYVVSSSDAPTMPFNRVDYYLGKTVTSNTKCHPNTYTMYRAGIAQSDGKREEQVLMDCVANFQVALGLDTDGDSLIDLWDDGTVLSTYDARGVFARVKMVKVFILTHEGLYNNEFTYTGTTQPVGVCINSNTLFCIGDDDVLLDQFNLAGLGAAGSGVTDYTKYKWTQLVLSGKSMNLCQESTASCL